MRRKVETSTHFHYTRQTGEIRMIRYIFIAVVILLTTFVSAQACLQVEGSAYDVRHEMTLETQPAGTVELSFVHVHDNHHYADLSLQSVSGRRWFVTYVGPYANRSNNLQGQLLSPADRPPIFGSVVLLPHARRQLQPAVSLATI
jgi:hypothetical protein